MTASIHATVRRVDHVALPYRREDAAELRRFWSDLGLEVTEVEVADPAYDHAGAGTRLHVGTVGALLVSYFPVSATPAEVEAASAFGHVALEIFPGALDRLRRHPAFERETRWGPGHDSLFLRGPYGLRVELVARGVI